MSTEGDGRRRRAWRGEVVLVAAAGLLAACATGDVLRQAPPKGYVEDAPAEVAAADWAHAQTVEVALSEYRFAPARLVFQKGTAYRLVLRNTGTSRHTFVSHGFFKAIAAQKLVTEARVVTEPYVESIEVPAGASKELFFVAVKRGGYHLTCTMFLHETFGMEGEITVR